jgi:ABC-type uncharacterized transport system substrate-binding protein
LRQKTTNIPCARGNPPLARASDGSELCLRLVELKPKIGYMTAYSAIGTRRLQITAILKFFRVGRLSSHLLVLALFFIGSSPVLAHPHVWVTAQANAIFSPEGKITAIRHIWVFDDMYSAFVTQGIGKDGGPATVEDLAPLAKTNVESLAEFAYFTHAKVAGKAVDFVEPTEYSLEERPDKLVVLRFTLPLKEPASAAKAFSFQVYDPTYFVAFSLAAENPVSFVNAPQGCSTNVLGSNPLAANETKKLSEAFFSGLSPGVDFGVKLASRVIIACP